MAAKSIKGNNNLAKRIRTRRNELNLTIEEAAARANVGTKTWSRYEAGEAIRQDKIKGVCKALNWRGLPGDEELDDETGISIEDLKQNSPWSSFLEKSFGRYAAVSFAIGSDILSDFLKEDLSELSTMPKWSHVGQIETSMLKEELPAQFLTRYDYEFIYCFYLTVERLRLCAKRNLPIIAHSVLEELALFLISRESEFLLECMKSEGKISEEEYDTGEDWAFDLFGDMDIVTWLYSDIYLTEENEYHFTHWLEQQFFCEQKTKIE